MLIIELDQEYDILYEKNPGKYEFTDLLSKWKDTWAMRFKKLIGNKKNEEQPISLKVYFNSFPCLQAPQALELVRYFIVFIMVEPFFPTKTNFYFLLLAYFQLISDFKQLIENSPSDKAPVNNGIGFYNTAFVTRWPGEAKKIISFVKSSTNQNLKNLCLTNPTLFDTGRVM